MIDTQEEIITIINKLLCLINFTNDYDKLHENFLKDLFSHGDNKIPLNKSPILSEVHVIECIGKNRLPNLTFISKELKMSKGAISKIISKLLEEGFIRGNHLEDNKKEIYYVLTAQGKKIFEGHEEFHNIEKGKFTVILTKYGKEDLQTINNFLNDVLKNFYIT